MPHGASANQNIPMGQRNVLVPYLGEVLSNPRHIRHLRNVQTKRPARGKPSQAFDFAGAGNRSRTCDLRITNALLYSIYSV